jgi:Bacterial lipid A biosynthesis acyltransferase
MGTALRVRQSRQPGFEAGMLVGSAATRFVVWLRLAVSWSGFYFLRACERLLPTSVLDFLLWPVAAASDLLDFRSRKLLTSWRRIPKSWHPNRWRFIYGWPDRLCAPEWLKRCRLEGQTHLVTSRNNDRPIVLASLHFGPYETFPYWLRAHGVATTMIRGLAAPEALKSLSDYQYSLSPPADVPVFLSAKELAPLPRFSHIRQFLGPGRRLLVMVDVDRGMQFHLPFQDRSFRMASGAIRLAAMANAELIPCLIRETGSWRFAIWFGTPVPREYLDNSLDLQSVGAHLLNEFSKLITRYPEQCRARLLSALEPA